MASIGTVAAFSMKPNALLSVACVALLTATLGFAAERRPNIVFIMADDLGYTDVASFGSKYYETPNIDQLASQGLKLTAFHQCQNCAPTRAALMSGQLGPRTGVYTVGGINRFDWSSRPLRPVANVTELPLDRDIIVSLFRDPAAKLKRDAIFQHFPGYLGYSGDQWRTTPVTIMQSGDWKLMEYLEDGKLELYNLKDDLGETKNLAASMPEISARMHERMIAWRKDIKAPMPTKNDASAGTAEKKRKRKAKAKVSQ
jgi:arylsulfatase A-like enzyme